MQTKVGTRIGPYDKIDNDLPASSPPSTRSTMKKNIDEIIVIINMDSFVNIAIQKRLTNHGQKEYVKQDLHAIDVV